MRGRNLCRGKASLYSFIISLLLFAARPSLSQTNIILPVDYWDFLYSGTVSGTGVGHPDFQHFNNGLVTGLVQSTFGPGTVPVWASDGGVSQSLTGPVNFSQWYHNTSNINVYCPGVITLTNIGSNTFQFSSTDFFPLDGQGFNTNGGQTDLACDASGPHNFSFTTHIQFTTQFTSNSQSISVTGKDDIWVFINGHLVIDLGGVHNSTTGNWTASAGNLTAVGASLAQTVPVDIFQAQRHTCASVFGFTVNSANIIPALLPTVGLSNAGSQVQITYAGVIQQSTNLTSWQDVTPQPASPWTFTPTNNVFYRARR